MYPYTLPRSRQAEKPPAWPRGVGEIPAELPGGTPVLLPVLEGVNTLVFGTVGTGKTKSFIEPVAEALMNANPDRLCVFSEFKHGFLDRFCQPDDMVLAHNPEAVSKGTLFIPNIIKEIRQSADPIAEARAFVDFLHADMLQNGGQNLGWVEASRNTFLGVLRVILDCFPDYNVTNRTLICAMKQYSTVELLRYIALHPENHSMLQKEWNFDPLHPEKYVPGRRAEDIMFYLSKALEAFSGVFLMDGEHTLHEWMEGKYGRNLFFLCDLNSMAASRPFFLYYLKKLKTYKMGLSGMNSAPILMVLDEIDKLSEGGHDADWGLFQAANLGRESGLQLLVATQSMENLYGLAPDYNSHITQAGIAGFPYLVAFRPGDPFTISTLQTLFGSEHREHVVMPVSRYADPTVKSELEPIVTDAMFSSLGLGECYIKVMNSRPQRIRIHIK